MTPQKQRKQRDRKERLRVHKHTAPPRRPFQTDPRRLSRREALRRFNCGVEDALLHAEALWKKEQRLFDTIKQMQEVFCRKPEDPRPPVLCLEPDGRLTPMAELKARYPGYIDIALPPIDPADTRGIRPEDLEEVTAENPPIVEFPIDGAPGWRLALVPPSRFRCSASPVQPDAEEDLDELDDLDEDEA